MFAQLGNHKFQGLKTPTTLNESYAAKYGRIPRVNGKDIIQFTGEELVEGSLSFVYNIDFCDPVTEIEALKASQRAAEVLPLVLGDGTVKGSFVITDLEINNQRYSAGGRLEMASVSLNLLERVTNQVAKPKGIAVIKSPKIGVALVNVKNTSSVVAVKPPAKPLFSPAKVVTNAIAKADGAVNKMKSVGEKVQKKTAGIKNAVRDVKKLADEVKQAYQMAKEKVEDTKKIIERASQLPKSLDEAMNYADSMTKLGKIVDAGVLQKNITQMSSSADKVKVSASAVTAFAATKEGGK